MSDKSHSVTDAVLSRISVRAFSDRWVDTELLRHILATAARSPSGGNLQPWHVDVLIGDRLAQFKALVAERRRVMPQGEEPEYEVYPKDLMEPYKARRSKCGEDMYATLSISREQRAERLAFIAGNFAFWNAPVGMFFSLERSMGPPQWSDLGMFMQTVMLLAREAGLHTCAQEAWNRWHATISQFIGMPASRMLFCGMAIGYADPGHAVNTLRTQREALDQFATFHGM